MLPRGNPADTLGVYPDRMLQLDIAMEFETHLLIVDDDAGIRELTAAYLTGHGYTVDVAANATDMRAAMAEISYALIVLDVMMPGEDGLSVLRSLDRATAPPVVMLSAIGSDIDRIVGLEMGADDYLAKPANPRELLARIRAVLRRRESAPLAPGQDASAPPGTAISTRRAWWHFAGWRLDPVGRELIDPDETMIDLSDGEFRLLLAFVERPRRVLTRDQLLDLSRGAQAEHFDRAIDVQVSRLRRKLARDGSEELVRTIRNEGYMFVSDVAR